MKLEIISILKELHGYRSACVASAAFTVQKPIILRLATYQNPLDSASTILYDTLCGNFYFFYMFHSISIY
jgi:hypothetical protein